MELGTKGKKNLSEQDRSFLSSCSIYLGGRKDTFFCLQICAPLCLCTGPESILCEKTRTIFQNAFLFCCSKKWFAFCLQWNLKGRMMISEKTWCKVNLRFLPGSSEMMMILWSIHNVSLMISTKNSFLERPFALARSCGSINDGTPTRCQWPLSPSEQTRLERIKIQVDQNWCFLLVEEEFSFGCSDGSWRKASSIDFQGTSSSEDPFRSGPLSLMCLSEAIVSYGPEVGLPSSPSLVDWCG